MKIKKVNGLQVKPIKTGAKPDTPKHLPNLGLCVLVGKRGSGKSVSATNLFRLYKEGDPNAPYRFLVISSTFHSNWKLMESLDIDPDDIFDPDDPDTPFRIDEIVNAERDDLMRYHRDMKMYKEFMRQLRKRKQTDEDEFEDMLLQFYNPDTDSIEKPTHRWDGKCPRIVLFVDDCMNSKVLTSRKFSNLCIRHRHSGSFPKDFQEEYPHFPPAVGVWIYMTIQAFKSVGGGLPKHIRTNATQLIIFRTASDSELMSIYESVQGDLTFEKFYQAYDYATSRDYGFLLIDLDKKRHHPSMLRSGFDEYIILD